VKLSDLKGAIPDECEVNPVPPADGMYAWVEVSGPGRSDDSPDGGES
jgi:hypothetical protein